MLVWFSKLLHELQSWDSFFRNSASGGSGYQAPPSLAPLGKNEVLATSFLPALAGASAPSLLSDKVIDDHLAVQAIIRSYQVSYWINIISGVLFALKKWELFFSMILILLHLLLFMFFKNIIQMESCQRFFVYVILWTNIKPQSILSDFFKCIQK